MKKALSVSYLSIALIAFIILPLAGGCTTTPARESTVSGARSASDEKRLLTTEQKLTEQSRRYNRTVAEGAVAGAIVGAIIAGAISGKTEHVFAGAALGAAAGAATGTYIAKKQKQYANAVDRIDSMISDVNSENAALRNYVVTVDQYISETKGQIARINKKYRAEQISKNEAKSQIERVVAQRHQINQAVSNLKTAKAEFSYAAEKQGKESGQESVAILSRRIDDLGVNIQNLENELDSLDEALQLSVI